jgi:hypothetical protein
MRVFNRGLRPTAALWLAACLSGHAYAQVSVLTWHNDQTRTGQNLQETVLTPANVNSSTFGKLFTISVDGLVDAQPLYVPSVTVPGNGVRNVLYIVTENDSAYAFDADNGAQYWQVSLLGTDETPSDDRGCGQVTPTIGATATPAIDLSIGPHGTLYTVAMTKDSSAKYHHRLHALDLTTGAEQFSGPKEVQATYPGTGAGSSKGTVTFNPAQYKERPGLLILNGVVYTSWGSHCDAGPYTGWLMGYNETTLAQVSVLDLTPNGNDGGIWMAGAGPAADAGGNIYLLVGNGTFDTTLSGGFPSKNDYGNAFVKISTSGRLSVADYFTMDNTVSESNGDTDFGSGGMMLLPALTGQGGSPVSLAVCAGKDGNIYVVNQANLGKFSSSADNIYQQMSGVMPSGVWSSPAWFNGYLYYGGVSDYVKAFAFTNGSFDTVPSSQSPTTFGYPGATPSISANGSSNGIVWAAENTAPAVLHAYDASNLATELYNSNQAANDRDQFGSGNKYIVPTIANGKVYVGTTSGVGVFGLFPLPNNRSFVAENGNDNNYCTANASCRTLAAALALTNPGGEIVLVDSGSYGAVTITQPVVITAIGIDASIAATSGNALTINTSGNVTITGLNLDGGGTGNDGVLVQSVGHLRLYDMQIRNFANNGIEFTANGDLSVYDSKVNDSGHDGLLLNSASAKAYVHNTDFDHNTFAGADSVSGNMTVADSSAHYNQYAFYADSGTVALNNDRAMFNTNGLAANSTGTLYFADCLISDNTTAWSVAAGGTMADSNPGTSLITPGQGTAGTLSIATTLQ